MTLIFTGRSLSHIIILDMELSEQGVYVFTSGSLCQHTQVSDGAGFFSLFQC